MKTSQVFRDFMTLIWDTSGELYEDYYDATETAKLAFGATLIPTGERENDLPIYIAVFPDKTWAHIHENGVLAIN